MAAEIIIGKQSGQSTSKNELKMSDKSKIRVKFGELTGRAKRDLKVDEYRAGTGDGSAKEVWAKGSFFLVAIAMVAAIFAILAHYLSWYSVPIAVVGSIVALYLLGLILQPEGPLTEKGLLSVLQMYVRLAFARRPEAKAKTVTP
jgi:hypothetical protein